MTNFNDIKFDHGEHSYLYKGTKLVSVTTLISRIKPAFEKLKVASNVAARDNKSVQEVLDEWEKSGEEARDKGTIVHSYIEDTINRIPDLILNHVNRRIPEMDAFDKAYTRLSSNLDTKFLMQEITVGDKDYGLAGRVDCLLTVSTSSAKEMIHIFDWKTGKKFETQNAYGKMLPPFDDLDDCAYNHYSIQTSLYRLMLERNRQVVGGIDTSKRLFGDSYLLHLKNDGSYQLHRAKDFRDRIADWLKDGLPSEVNYDNKDEEFANKLCSYLESWDKRRISVSTKTKITKAIKHILMDIQ